MVRHALALNGGSSSVKYALFDLARSDVVELKRGSSAFSGDDHDQQVDQLGDLLADLEREADCTIDAVGHRIVHGGTAFLNAVRLDDAIIAALDALTPLAPLHQPGSLKPIRALKRLRPDMPQFASFDTSFHRTMVPPQNRFALPREWEAKGIRRYGFHGLSYAYIAAEIAKISPAHAGKKSVVAHLGSGASTCAICHGRSVETSMGFTPLDGLMMGTRCGTLDPGIVIYLLRTGMSVDAIEDLLYHKSGLIGVSGFSSDVRDLLASDDPRAGDALDLFNCRVAEEITVMANALGGVDLIVFTGGIGEHAAPIRLNVMHRLAWLGVEADTAANARGDAIISTAASRVEARVMATDEEMMIARDVKRLFAT